MRASLYIRAAALPVAVMAPRHHADACRLLSSVVVELVPLPENKVLSLPGQWLDSSGGCDLHPFWFKHNPHFLLVPHEPLTVTITLARALKGWKRGTSLDHMIGFYIVAADDETGHVAQPSKAAKAETAFVPLQQVSLTYELRTTASTPAFVIVPCTYGPGVAGQFQLCVSAATSGFQFSAVGDRQLAEE